jgi:putative flippase GtrA
VNKRFRGLFADAVRFLGIGAVNALLTTALYQLALFWLPYKTSFVVAWLAGLAFVSFAYPKLVFRTGRAGPYRVLANAGYYVASFFLSYWLLDQFARLMSERLAVFAMLAVITPLNFFVSRYIFRSGRNSSVFESIAHEGRS